ncbi:MAG: DUF1207 domain-containing protein [bacterium]
MQQFDKTVKFVMSTLRNVAMLVLVCASGHVFAATDSPGDEYILGYADALMKSEFFGSVQIRVNDGMISFRSDDLSSEEQRRLAQLLADIPGVKEVVPDSDPIPQDDAPSVAPNKKTLTEKTDLLPRTALFLPLLADPRWPHFAASYQYYLDEEELHHVGAVSFGETVSLLRYRFDSAGALDLGIQAGVFSIFDLEAESSDLINSDFWVGLPLSYRYGDFSALLRIYHQSSHLGDEYLLRDDIDERINLSYEGAHLLLSYELLDGLRGYGGGGYLLRKEPDDLDPWSVQWGLEYRNPETWYRGRLRPVFALDLQNVEETDWDFDVSARAGFQFENPDVMGRKLQILLEYYNGHSPNGQFFDSKIEYFGLGVHYHLY